MTAKEKLLARVVTLSEAEAEAALRFLETGRDPVLAPFRSAPPDDEPWTEADEAAAAEGRADVAAGRVVALDEALRDAE